MNAYDLKSTSCEFYLLSVNFNSFFVCATKKSLLFNIVEDGKNCFIVYFMDIGSWEFSAMDYLLL